MSVADFNPGAGEFPEGIAVDQEGNIYVGMAFTSEIKKITPEGQVSTFTNLPLPGGGFMLGMAFDHSDDLYVALASFDAATHGIHKVSQGGNTVELFTALPTNGLPNGLAFDNQGNLFASDSFLGRIWKIDQEGNASIWKDDPLLVGAAGPPLNIPIGANGIAFDAGQHFLYATNTDLGGIVRIPTQDDGSAGDAEAFVTDLAMLKGADGIAIDNDGNLYVPVNRQDRIVIVSPDGDISILAEGEPLQFPASPAFGKGQEKKTLYITNFALFRFIGATPGTPEPALLKMLVEVPGS